MGHKLFPGRGVPNYPNVAAFPEGAQGDLAVSIATNALYEYDGSAWNIIASATIADVLSTPITGYVAATGTVAATDTILQAFDKLGYHAITHNPEQTVTVCAAGGAQFTSIGAALTSITDNAANKAYVVLISAGTYIENVTMKPYVALVGVGNGPAAPVIVGTITNTTTGTEWSLLNRINHAFTITADGQSALISSGSLLVNDYFLAASTTGNYTYDVIDLTHTSASSPTVIFSSYITLSDTYNGSTKARNLIKAAGTATAQPLNLGQSTLVMNVAASSGDLKILQSSADCPLNIDSNGLTFVNSKAAFAGTIEGFCILNASSYARSLTFNTITLQGTSGGTAYGTCLDSGGNSATFITNGNTLKITGFTNKYASFVDATDFQKDWLTSMEGNYSKAGTGMTIITPYDLEQSGFVQWTGSGNYYSFVPGTGVFTLLRPCAGLVKSTPVYIASGQTVTLTPNFAAYFIYADADGVLQFTTSPTFDEKVLLFSVYSDGTYYRVSKQTHLVKFPAAVSDYIHNANGSTMKNDANGVLTLLSGAGRTIKLVGASTYYDHGLNTTIADSGVNAISMKMMYTGASGATYQGAAFTAIPGVRQNGTALSNTTNGKFVNYRIGVFANSNLSDAAADQIAQYLIVPDSTEHNSASAAANQITANTVAAFPLVATAGLEVINIGFATIQGDGSGGGTLGPVTPAKQVFGVNFASGATSSAGSVTTDISLFDKNLSATDTSVQIALNTLDEFNSLPNNATNASASPDLTNKTTFASAASGTTATFTFDARGAIEFLVDVNTDGGMTIACDYKSTIINALSDPSGLFLDTDAGTGIYVSKSANSAVVSLKNNMGATKTIGVLAVRSPITAATAWS